MKNFPAAMRLAGSELQVLLAEPMKIPSNPFVQRDDLLLERCRSAWGIEQGKDGMYYLADLSPAMSFRLEGPPGSGKNEIVYQLARELGCDLYVQNGHEDLTPEDLSLLLVPDRKAPSGLPVALHASPLATAILKGGLFFFDQIHRVPERTLAALASVLDDRHKLYSAATGVWIQAVDEKAARSFRFCCAVDQTAGRTLPAYIEQRTTPSIVVPMLNERELREMIVWDVEIRKEDVHAFMVSHEHREQTEVEEHGELRERELLARLLRVQEEDRQRRFADAVAQANAGHWQAAASAFKAIARELPKRDEMRRQCLNNFAHCHMELGHLKKALRICDDLLQESPDFALAVCTRADIFCQLAERTERIKDHKRFQDRARSLYQGVLELPSLEAFVRQHAEARLRELGFREPTE